MARIFLSYARDDAELAKKLAGLIVQSGHQVWWDREIQGGSHFSSEIDKALQDAEFRARIVDRSFGEVGLGAR